MIVFRGGVGEAALRSRGRMNQAFRELISGWGVLAAAGVAVMELTGGEEAA